MKRDRARITDNDPLNHTRTDKVINTLGGNGNITSQEDINTSIQQDNHTARHKPKDKMRKVTFQIRDSVMDRLKDAHRYLEKEMQDDAPDREVIVEAAIVRVLKQLEEQANEELKAEISERQKIRRTELSTGLLEKYDSRKKKN